MASVDVDLVYLQKQLDESFSKDDVVLLCDTLGIDADNIGGDTKIMKCRELVKYCYRQGRLAELITACQQQRPQATWDQPPPPYRQGDLPDDWVEPLQRLYRLVKAFNRNRQSPFSNARTWQGDELAFEMREAAPFVFNQFDVSAWLRSDSVGKRLAAIKYLDWVQDIEYLDSLLARLFSESPFVQFHILLALDSLVDQLDDKAAVKVKGALAVHNLFGGDAEREYWRTRILKRLDERP